MKKINISTIRRITLAVFLVFALGTVTSCTNDKTEPEVHDTTQEMIDYYDIASVENFHREMQRSLTDVITDLKDNDENALAVDLDTLNELCDEFIAVKDVPESLKPYHEKMTEAAQSIKTFSKDIAADDFISAAKELNGVQELFTEAQELLPGTTT